MDSGYLLPPLIFGNKIAHPAELLRLTARLVH